jgi:hypothetical protein
MAFEIIEDLLRDASLHAVERGPLLNPDRPDVVEYWSRRAWPEGIARCNTALAESRQALRVYVTGRTVMDALFATLARELG